MNDSAGKKIVNLGTIYSLLDIMTDSPDMQAVRFNVMRNRPERYEDGRWREWTDTDDNELIAGFQEKGVKSRVNILAAFDLFLKNHQVNPLRDLVDAIPWDGVHRCGTFLPEVMGAADDEYTRECSRLLFAGGIQRLYNPGCKVDSTIVLIGPQGGGKSTITQWLAMDDTYFRELNTIDGREGVEILQGCWICEISEMLATTKAREVEAVKGYLTRQVDSYREPYSRRVTDIPRRCLFIGTGNNPQFLTDKTGNRRFFPVITTITGAALWALEDDVKAYIAQCWAEAREKRNTDEMKPVPKAQLLDVIREKQAAAVEDDWRVGKIQAYLDDKKPGDVVCVIELWENALGYDMHTKPTKKDSTEISQILRTFPEWVSAGKAYRFAAYGPQKAFRKVAERLTFPPADMPFGKKPAAPNPDEPPPKFIL